MISVIVTTKDPEETFHKSYDALLSAVSYFHTHVLEETIEIIIVSPNTYVNLKTLHETIPVIFVTDEKKGKPAAINVAIKKAKGDLLFFTDGDVLLDKNALFALYTYIQKNKLSIAGGKPVSMSNKKTMLGYWSWVLCEGNADRVRTAFEKLRKDGHPEFFAVSGYFFAIKKEIMKSLNPHILSDDAYISYSAFKKGYDIGYCRKAIVYVKYAETYHDYIAQKVRSTGGYIQDEVKESKSRTFMDEALKGTLYTIIYAKDLRELWWSMLLLVSRLHIWLLIFFKIKILKRENIWTQIDSTKKI